MKNDKYIVGLLNKQTRNEKSSPEKKQVFSFEKGCKDFQYPHKRVINHNIIYCQPDGGKT